VVEETQITGLGRATSRRTRDLAAEALRESDFSEVFESMGVEGDFGTASAALKAALGVKAAEIAGRAAKIAQKRKMRIGAATVVIAAQE